MKKITGVRAGKPKSRAGCATCKIRRIKCDETTPSCLKCINTGRTCDGYNSDHSPTRAARDLRATAVIHRAIDHFRGTSQEYRYLEYFRLHAAPALSGAYDSNFWTKLVLQFSASEPAILHAVTAIGLCHQRQEILVHSSGLQEADLLSLDDSGQALALQQYNKAIRSLVTRLSHRSNWIAAPDLALVSCLLFVCIECMRGREDLAISHIRAGLNILSACSTHFKVDRLPDSEATSMSIGDYVVPMFRRLNVQAMMFGIESSELFAQQGPFPSYTVSVSDVFQNFSEAGKSLLLLSNASLGLFNVAGVHRYNVPPLASMIDEQCRLLKYFEDWLVAFNAFVDQGASSFGQTQRREEKMLRISHRLTSIFVAAWLSPSEMVFDQFIPDFQAVVSLCLELNSANCELGDLSPVFSFEQGVISPLYLTVIKCRDPAIRRKALACLKTLHRREGLWNTSTHAAIAEKVIEYEEFSAPLDARGMPPDSARIHDVRIYRPDPSYSGVINVVFRFSPRDCAGSQVINEEFDLPSVPPHSPQGHCKEFDLFTLSTTIRFFRASNLGNAFTTLETSVLDQEMIQQNLAHTVSRSAGPPSVQYSNPQDYRPQVQIPSTGQDMN